MKKNKAFTLIELIAVLVILAIISLIVAPLILNIIRRVKDVANKRSVDGYGRAVEYAMASYQLEHLAYPDTFDKLEIEYKGNKVECKTNRINPDYSIYLSECKVNGRLVKDDKEYDGYYHYGILKMTNQEYVDTYGKNLEDALKNYHDEHNEYPSDYTTLTLSPLDKEVVCDVQINYDGTIFLNNCKVDSEDVIDDNNEEYVYGDNKPYKPYFVGDEVKYNNIVFYVIKDSDYLTSAVTLLKKNPLTVNEVNLYGGKGTENNYINRYTRSSVGTANNMNGYGGVTYHSSETCGVVNGTWVRTNCDSNYTNSDIKHIVDAWGSNKFLENDLEEDEYGYKYRLIRYNELKENLGYGTSESKTENVPTWVYSYMYWTMTSVTSSRVKYVHSNGSLNNGDMNAYVNFFVRPVVTLKKSALE